MKEWIELVRNTACDLVQVPERIKENPETEKSRNYLLEIWTIVTF